MNKALPAIILFIVASSQPLIAQNSGIILGVVKDQKTGKPLSDVNVFIDNSTYGTTTGQNGKYKIGNLPSGIYTVIFTYIGYIADSRHITLGDNGMAMVNIDLKPQIYDMNEVHVVGKVPKKWRQDLQEFEKEFLGYSEFSKSCVIKNPQVLDFKRVPGSGALLAKADSMLVIDNNALGYQLYIHLDTFKWYGFWNNKNTGSFTLHPLFREMKPSSESQKKEWEANRKRAYDYSFRHFLYALSKHNAKGEGYSFDASKVRRLDEEENMYQLAKREIYNVSLTGYRMFTSFNVSYKLHNSGVNKTKYDYFFVDSNGNLLNPSSVALSGNWSLYRVASMLPFNYRPN